MKKLLYLTTFLLAGIGSLYAQQPMYNVTAGDGNGIRFWSNDFYKIHMGNTGLYHYGPVTGYSIKMNMNDSPGRGWTWGIQGQSPIAALNNQGNMQIAGNFATLGQIGIGTANVGGDYLLQLWQKTDDRFGGIRLRNDSNGQSSFIWMDQDDHLRIDNSSSASRDIIINGDGNGNVGIGTTNPGAGLHVVNDLGILIDDSQTGFQGAIKMTDGFSNTASKDDMLFESDGAFLFKLDKNGNGISNYPGFGIFDKNDNTIFFARDNGKVGIGTTAPTSKLHIKSGSSGSTPHSYSKLSVEGNSHSMVEILTPNTSTAYFGFADPEDTYVSGMSYSHANDEMKFTVNNSTALFINSEGRMGIGTTNPEPNSKLTVAGKIDSREIKVTVDAGADFVFEGDYDLKPLKEVEHYIKTNKHLPEIPSEKQMIDNGLLLGEMNIKLLQKVEELTLYTIEQQKLIEKLIKRIETLENK